MPFRSEKQRRFMWAKHPEIAERWAKKYGSKIEATVATRELKRRKKKGRFAKLVAKARKR